MNFPPQQTGPRTARGFTILELAISATLIVVVFELVAGTTLMVSRSGKLGHRQATAIGLNQHALQKISNEVRTSSTGVDPVTGQPYLTVGGAEGSRTLTFRRVVSYGSNGAELKPVWSTPIEYRLQNGVLVRRQDGQDIALMQNVVWLEFGVDAVGRVQLALGNAIAGGDVAAAAAVHERVITTMF